MKLQFKVQQYQSDAVDAVLEVFSVQPYADGVKYRIDPGKKSAPTLLDDVGLLIAEIALTPPQIVTNVHRVQQERRLGLSQDLMDPVKKSAASINLDVEMEIGTGKTYVYTKTIMELHKRYGWSKEIVVVPSIAIREGMKKFFDITAEHFQLPTEGSVGRPRRNGAHPGLTREITALEKKVRSEPQLNRKLELRSQINERTTVFTGLTDPVPSNRE